MNNHLKQAFGVSGVMLAFTYAAQAAATEFNPNNVLVESEQVVSAGAVTVGADISTTTPVNAAHLSVNTNGDLTIKTGSSPTLEDCDTKYSFYIAPTGKLTVESGSTFSASNTARVLTGVGGEQGRVDGTLDVYGSFTSLNNTAPTIEYATALGFDLQSSSKVTIYNGGSVTTNSAARLQTNSNITVNSGGTFQNGAWTMLTSANSSIDVYGTYKTLSTTTYKGGISSFGSSSAKSPASVFMSAGTWTFYNGSVGEFESNTCWNFYLYGTSKFVVNEGATLTFDNTAWTGNVGAIKAVVRQTGASLTVNGSMSITSVSSSDIGLEITESAKVSVGSKGSYSTNGIVRVNTGTLTSNGAISAAQFRTAGGTAAAANQVTLASTSNTSISGDLNLSGYYNIAANGKISGASITSTGGSTTALNVINFGTGSETKISGLSAFTGNSTITVADNAVFESQTMQIGGAFNADLGNCANIKTDYINFQGINGSTDNIVKIGGTIRQYTNSAYNADYKFRSESAFKMEIADGVKMGYWDFDTVAAEGNITIELATEKSESVLIESITSTVKSTAATGSFTFKNFENDYFELQNIDNINIVGDRMRITFVEGENDYSRYITLIAYDNDGTKMDGDWGIVNIDGHNYLNIGVPEPSTYAALFGVLALAYCVSRRSRR